MRETILARLRHEHTEIRKILEEMQMAQTADAKLLLLDELKTIFVPHMEGEELTIYSKIKDEPYFEAAQEMVKDALIEHKELKEHLQRLTLMEPETEEWLKEFHYFKTNVERHFLEEETELFNEIKEDFSRKELEELSDDFEEIKHHSL